MTAKADYLKAGKASDIPTPGGRILYRAFEMLPAALAWVTIIGIFAASRFTPVAASFFVIAFDIYWLFKTVFLSLHLRAGYNQMQRHLKTDWMVKLRDLQTYNLELKTSDWRDIRHLIILPFYRESYEVMRHGLEAFAANSYPKERMFIVLGVEERAGPEARAAAVRLEHEFKNTFAKFLTVVHPADLPGEIAGKGSNETFAAKKAKADIIDPAGIPYERVIVSSFDSDTIVPPHYFAILTYHLPFLHFNIMFQKFFQVYVAQKAYTLTIFLFGHW